MAASNYARQDFLDFHFNGHWASDFGLTVTSNSDRFSTNFHSQFTNNTSTIPGKEGNLYWNTQVTNQVITFNTVAEELNSRELEKLKAWLRPGKISPLIFGETPYKYYLVILNNPAIFNFIPFDGETIINSIAYPDILYRGELVISFATYSTKAYGKDPDENYNYSFFNDVDNENVILPPWFISSGIPLQTMLPSTGTVFLGNGYRGNALSVFGPEDDFAVPVETQKDFFVYNAGTVNANTNTIFYKNVSLNGDILSWTPISFFSNGKSSVVTQPRLLADFKYVLNLLSTYNDSSFAAAKISLQQELNQVLDGALKTQILGILKLTGNGLQWPTLSQGIQAIKDLIENKKIIFSINGILQQCILHLYTDLWSFGAFSATANLNKLVEENFNDAFNNNYIEIAGSIEFSDTMDMKTITVSGGPLENLYIYYKYTYA